ncbi:hypothetical protein HK102_007219 [Quaeritorhiza haematococci]|nr:hypothetical protein HK102_007219 [Quaeritorhiza haematococci]
MCLAYVIFASVMFNLQADSLSQGIEWTYGSDIAVRGAGFLRPLPEKRLRTFLESVKMGNPNATRQVVRDYTFVTYPLNSFYAVRYINAGTLVSLSNPSVSLIGLERNFLNVALNDYYMIGKSDNSIQIYQSPTTNTGGMEASSTPSDDLVGRTFGYVNPMAAETLNNIPKPINVTQSWEIGFVYDPNTTELYTKSIPVLVSDSLRSSAQIDVGGFISLTIGHVEQTTGSVYETRYLCRPIATLKKLAAFTNIARVVTRGTPLIVSMEMYDQILRGIEKETGYSSVRDATGMTMTANRTSMNLPPPKGRLLISVSPLASTMQIESLVDDINTIIADDDVDVRDLRTEIGATQQASKYIIIIFYVVAIVGIIFCFFVLWLSFAANMRENAWELGVLRALGLSVGSVTRIYIYEAISIMLACIITGTVIGLLIGATLALQFNVFTELPIKLRFPSDLYVILVAASVLVSIVGSYVPTKGYTSQRIAAILKGK